MDLFDTVPPSETDYVPGFIKTVEDAKNEIVKAVARFNTAQLGKPCPMSYLSRAFNRRVNALEHTVPSLVSTLHNEKRLYVFQHSKNQATYALTIDIAEGMLDNESILAKHRLKPGQDLEDEIQKAFKILREKRTLE